MKRLMRILVLAGGVLMLLLGPRTRSAAQDKKCCAESDEIGGSKCGSCGGGFGACQYNGDDSWNAYDCAFWGGGMYSPLPGQPSSITCDPYFSTCDPPGSVASCPTSDTGSYWAQDPSCQPEPSHGLPEGSPCVATIQCDGTLQCFYDNTRGGMRCQVCPGDPCYPNSESSSACGTWRCDTAECLPQCHEQWECWGWQYVLGSTCAGGCCDPPPDPGDPGDPCEFGSCSANWQCVSQSCAYNGVTGCCNGGSPPPPQECYEDENCGYYGWCDANGTCQYDTPVVIDLAGDGFDLTNAASGVVFDISGSGKPIRIAWTRAGTDDAWLVLDRNGNGRIDNGTEMFGNFTPQPATSKAKNGFLALAVYDQPANGGNGDGVIDARDRIFASLRLWIDKNHNGVSEPGELFTLPDQGITAIDLKYHTSWFTDAAGNLFHYRAKITRSTKAAGKGNSSNGGPPAANGQWAYDVTLKTR